MPPKNPLTEVNLNIGDIILTATAVQDHFFAISAAHGPFLVANGSPDICLNYRFESVPKEPLGHLIFTSGGSWSLYQRGREFVIPLNSELEPERLAVLDQSFSNGQVYIRPLEEALEGSFSKNSKGAGSIDPFEYPLDEVIIINFLARGRGVIFHACGVVDEGRGRLFVGVSGAGKSTLAELWKPTGVTLLSDDRIIVRPREGGFRMYGTPWHGDARIASPESAPLERLFFIEHATRNYVKELSAVDAAARLLVRCFPPFYDKAGMEFILDFLAQIAEEIPCYELGFVPDASAIDFVRGVK